MENWVFFGVLSYNFSDGKILKNFDEITNKKLHIGHFQKILKCFEN